VTVRLPHTARTPTRPHPISGPARPSPRYGRAPYKRSMFGRVPFHTSGPPAERALAYVGWVGFIESADEWYAKPAETSTAAPAEAAAQARSDGDRPLPTQLAALKRPTVGAWLVNVVALRQPAALDQLFAAADAIRGANGAAELRELSQRRRK